MRPTPIPPASIGRASRLAGLEEARETIAEILDADLAPPRRDRLIFTSGGTEANNLAVLGIARAGRISPRLLGEGPGVRAGDASPRLLGEGPGVRAGDVSPRLLGEGPGVRAGNVSPRPLGEGPGVRAGNVSPRPLGEGPGVRAGRIIISAAEHQSVIEPAEHLLEHGWRLDTLGLTPAGVVRVDQLPPLLGDCPNFRGHGGEAVVGENGTVPLDGASLVSVQLGNHETGVLQPLAELAAICNRAGVPLHTDAVQVVGKLPVSFRGLDVAAMSISAHKFQGPPGIGACCSATASRLCP